MDSIFNLCRQDFQDQLDILYTRFPEETGYVQSALRKQILLVSWQCGNSSKPKKSLEALISQFWPPNFRRKADAIFLVSSGNHEKIQFILLILSEKNA
jgi:hypothetical protein